MEFKINFQQNLNVKIVTANIGAETNSLKFYAPNSRILEIPNC